MFMQVYNHKTNVALNAMLAKAIPDAIDDARLDPPKDFEAYVQFTDDLVMSTILSLCVRGKKLANTVYGKTLAYRKIPMHLGFASLTTGSPVEIDEKRRAKAAEHGINPEKIITARATSELIKPGQLPKLVSRVKPGGELRFDPFESRSSLFHGPRLPQRVPPSSFLH